MNGPSLKSSERRHGPSRGIAEMTSPMKKFASWTSFFLIILCLCLSATAVPRSEEFRRHYDDALRLYEQGQYQSAIDEFQAAYAIKQLPRLLYNLARSHFQLGHAQEALEILPDLQRSTLQLPGFGGPEVDAKTVARRNRSRGFTRR